VGQYVVARDVDEAAESVALLGSRLAGRGGRGDGDRRTFGSTLNGRGAPCWSRSLRSNSDRLERACSDSCGRKGHPRMTPGGGEASSAMSVHDHKRLVVRLNMMASGGGRYLRTVSLLRPFLRSPRMIRTSLRIDRVRRRSQEGRRKPPRTISAPWP